jgi:peroxisomal coenzyme A diphosphatase NUDT7
MIGSDTFPVSKRGAVLILLFELNKDGYLRVLLTTRSKSLRSHPGQTALPGGKVDPSDKNAIATAVSNPFPFSKAV